MQHASACPNSTRRGGARRRGGQSFLWPEPGAERHLLLDRAGNSFVLCGLNGAGKTTLFSLISHLYDTR